MTDSIKSSITKWHEMIQSKNSSMLDDLLDHDVVFRSPVAYNSYKGKAVVYFILTNVLQVFEDFKYHREFFDDKLENIVLEFSANINGKSLKGIDMIQFNEKGQIIDFEVMVRPFTGLTALAEKMGEKFKNFKPE